MCMLDKLREKRELIYALAKKNKISKVSVFGSCARKEETSESDIDILVDFEKGSDLFDHIHMMNDMEELMQCKVDIVDRIGLHPYIRKEIIAEAIEL